MHHKNQNYVYGTAICHDDPVVGTCMEILHHGALYIIRFAANLDDLRLCGDLERLRRYSIVLVHTCVDANEKLIIITHLCLSFFVLGTKIDSSSFYDLYLVLLTYFFAFLSLQSKTTFTKFYYFYTTSIRGRRSASPPIHSLRRLQEASIPFYE